MKVPLLVPTILLQYWYQGRDYIYEVLLRRIQIIEVHIVHRNVACKYCDIISLYHHNQKR